MAHASPPSASGHITSVDPAALRLAAQRLDAAAEVLYAVIGTHLRAWEFDGSTAGRAHAASGWALRTALDGLRDDTTRWANATSELAAALRVGADVHARREAHAGAVLR